MRLSLFFFLPSRFLQQIMKYDKTYLLLSCCTRRLPYGFRGWYARGTRLSGGDIGRASVTGDHLTHRRLWGRMTPRSGWTPGAVRHVLLFILPRPSAGRQWWRSVAPCLPRLPAAVARRHRRRCAGYWSFMRQKTGSGRGSTG